MDKIKSDLEVFADKYNEVSDQIKDLKLSIEDLNGAVRELLNSINDPDYTVEFKDGGHIIIKCADDPDTSEDDMEE